MRIKKFTLMTLAFVMMSVVAFAQQTEQKALPSLKKQATLKQQILQAKREGKQLNKETIAQFKYNKPAASQIIKKQQRNLNLPVKEMGTVPSKSKSTKKLDSPTMAPRETDPYGHFASLTAPAYHRFNRAEAKDEHGIITEPAEGTVKVYNLAGSGYKYSNGSTSMVSQSGTTKIVECEDGTVYINNIVSTYATGAWVKGTKSGNTISVPAGQPLIYNSTYDTTISARWGVYNSGEVSPASPAAEDFTFIVDETAKTISLQGTSSELIMAALWDDDDTWTHNGVWETVYTYDHDYVEPKTVTIVPPVGLETTTWYTKGHTYSNGSLSVFRGTVTLGFDGNDVYVQGLFGDFPEAWLKGTINGTTVTFTDFQYQGQAYGYDIYGIGSDGSALTDFVMTYDAETGVFTSSNLLLANAALDKLYYLTWIDDVEISKIAPPQPITPPAGLTTEDWFFAGYFYNNQGEYPTEKPLKIGFDGKDVYVQGIGCYQPEAWIKGTLSDDGKSITFASNQYYGEYANEYDMWFAAYDVTAGALAPVTVAYDAENGIITWPEDVFVIENGEESELAMYGYYSEIVATFKGTAPAANEMPIGLLTEEWALKAQRYGDEGYEEYKAPINVGFAGNDVYVLGMFEGMSNCIVKGTLDPATNKVTFKNGQCMGVDYDIDWDTFTLIETPFYFAGYSANGLEDVVMAYDAETKTMTMESPMFCFQNGCWLLVDPYDIYADVVLQAIPDEPATPAQPEITGANLDGILPSIEYNIPTTDVDGNPILTGKLYYRFFYEIEHEVSPVVLSPGEYQELTEEMTEIPYYFSDEWDIYNDLLYLNMDFSEWNKIGIQTIYRGGGEEKKSEISWFKIKKYNPAVYNFAAAADAEEAVTNLNGSTANGGVFYGWESVSKPDSKRQDYKGYENYTGTNLPKECHVWRRNDRISGNLWKGGLVCPNNKEMAINGLEPGYKIVIDFDAKDAAGDKLLWVPGKGAEPQAVAVVGNADRSAVSGITEIASGDTIYFVSGAKDYFVFKVLKDMIIKKITIIDADPKVDFQPAYGVYDAPDIQHGTVDANIRAAVEGEIVTLSNTFDKGYSLFNYVVKDAEGNIIPMKSYNQFEMPASDVYISAEFNLVKDLTLDLTDPCNISEAVAEATEPGTSVGNLTIKLAFNTAYTITNPLEVRGAIKLIGENSTIDASSLKDPMIQMSKEPGMTAVESGQFVIANPILIEGVLVQGLTKALFADNGKSYTYKNFTINNSVFQYETQGNVVLNLASSMAINLNITNSTFWNKGASSSNFIAMSGKRPWQTTGFEDETGKFICANNTFYNIAKSKQFFNTNTLKGQKYLYEFNSNIFVNTSNKKIYGNMTNNKKQLTTDGKNTYLWGSLDYSDSEYEGIFFSETNYNGDEGLTTDPKFVDADKGDFTLGIGAKQQKLETGDPRWLTYYDPAFAEVENVNLTLTDGAEISSALAKYIYDKSIDKVGQITILLETGNYTIENTIEAPNTFVLAGLSTTTERVKIDASELNGPFVQMSKEPTLKTNEKGAFVDGRVTFMAVDINNLKQQLVYANKTQYLMEGVGVFDCVIGIDGTAKKTIFDFNGGGNTKELLVSNSTIWANPTNGQNGGFFSSQSSKDVRELDETATQTFTITNNTLYNITYGKTANTLRKNSQEYQKFIVANNIIVNCGKSNQFLKGLNAGQAGKDVNWEVDSNVFNFDGAISEEQQIGSSEDNIKNTINVLVQFKDAENGDFTQGGVKEAGDPRWYDENAPTAIETVKGDVERADDGAWYSIQGVRVDKPSKGVFIHNGRKVVIK